MTWSAQPTPRRRSILVVDDDPGFRAQVVPALERRGFAVIEAPSLRAAAEALAHAKPELLVVDGVLPDGRGAAFIEGQRRLGNAVPVVLCTSLWKDLHAFEQLTASLGLALVAHKPVSPTLLAEAICQILDEAMDLDITLDESAIAAPAAARLEFLRTLPGTLAELLLMVNEAQAAGDADSRARARRTAARLRIAAGSHGADELAAIAGLVVDALHVLDVEEGDGLWSEIEHGLESAMRAARELAAGNGTPSEADPPSRGRVLVVDRDPESALRIAELGRELHLDVTVAGSAPDAVARARRLRPDCVFVQLGLPDGSEALVRELRELPGCDSLPVAFTGLTDCLAGAQLGASLCLAEPVDGAAFEAAVKQLLAISRPRRPRVLCIDDDAAFAAQAAAVLGAEGIAVTHLAEPLRVLEVLDEVEPDLVLLDSVMPGLLGLDVCRLLRTTPRWQDVPVIFVTAEMGLDVRLAAFHAGVDDYLSRPVVDPELLARVRVRLERARLHRERVSTDTLTGLLLRRAFLDAATGRLAEARRYGRPLTVTLLDLDALREINERHGHHAGDRVLAAAGKLLASRLRAEDLRGRWGGEQLALVFSGHNPETTTLVVGRLAAELSRTVFRGPGGATFRATFCAATASFPDDGETLDELIATADRRLRESRRSARRARNPGHESADAAAIAV